MEDITITLPQYVGENNLNLVPVLLKEFDWDFEENYQQYHPVMTGNCCDGDYHPDYICDGDTETSGFYQNATWCCEHCYPSSNRAIIEWKDGEVTLICDASSSKPYRMMKKFYELVGEENNKTKQLIIQPIQNNMDKCFNDALKHLNTKDDVKCSELLGKRDGLEFALKIIKDKI